MLKITSPLQRVPASPLSESKTTPPQEFKQEKSPNKLLADAFKKANQLATKDSLAVLKLNTFTEPLYRALFVEISKTVEDIVKTQRDPYFLTLHRLNALSYYTPLTANETSYLEKLNILNENILKSYILNARAYLITQLCQQHSFQTYVDQCTKKEPEGLFAQEKDIKQRIQVLICSFYDSAEIAEETTFNKVLAQRLS